MTLPNRWGAVDPTIRTIVLSDGRLVVEIKAGYIGSQKAVPKAGEARAFWCDRHRRRVEVCRSSAGRSVRVFVDGVEVRS